MHHVRKAELNKHAISILKSKFDEPTEALPKDALDVFAENTPVNKHNATILDSTNNELCSILATGHLLKKVAKSNIK